MKIRVVVVLVLTIGMAHGSMPRRCAKLCRWASRRCGGIPAPKRCTGLAMSRCEAAGLACDLVTTTTMATEPTTTTTTTDTTTTTQQSVGSEISGLFSADFAAVDDGCGLLAPGPYMPGVYLLDLGGDGFYADLGSTLGTSGKVADGPAVLWSGPNPDESGGSVTAIGGLTCQAFELNSGPSECCWDATFTLHFTTMPMTADYTVHRRCISVDAAQLDCTSTMVGPVS